MKNLIIAIIVLPLLAYGGMKGAVWYKTKQELDHAIEQTALFADITYGDITSSLLDNQVSINNVNVAMKQSGEHFSIETLSLSTQDLFKIMLEGAENMVDESGTLLLHQLSIDVRGFTLDLSSDLAEDMLVSDRALMNLDALACGEIKKINAEALQAMGYSSLIQDFRVSLQFVPTEQVVKVHVNSGTRDMYALSVKAKVFLGVDELTLAGAPTLSPKLSQFSMTFYEQSYLERQKAFCATQLGVSDEEYVPIFIDTLERSLAASGIVVGPKVHEAMMTFYRSPSSLTVEVNPTGPIEVEYLDVYNPKDLVDWIGLDIYFNDQKLSELDVIWKAKSLSEAGLSVPKWSEQDDPNKSKVEATVLIEDPQAKIVEPIKLPKKRFRVTRVDDLPRFKGYRVYVSTKKGQDYRGTLKSVEADYVTILHNVPGGQAMLPLSKDGIEEIKVYY